MSIIVIYFSQLQAEGPLAQLVEQWTFNPFVRGSNPRRPTIIFKKALY